ncbi:DUF4422 domain-containing protein [uncultured Streptococcus sp.]|uniref:DUF4422 domain-containing protein n=1 Tax=uncultured Streptococcus sp. TaxID=83427 RepID=UPI0025F81465|nr:DUF4422 domain-containing protein [uncultured Streptococcus sp.]
MKKLTMYMVTHKDIDFLPNGRTPIFVGNGKSQNEYIHDNTLENISDKNKFFCELTAYYWIWKNDNESEYVSIEHYRRFFMTRNIVPHIVTKDGMEKLLSKYDVITGKFALTKMNLKDFYFARHYGEDLLLAQKRIAEKHPKYLDTFERIMNGNKSPMFNMLCTSKKLFDDYCEWLFDILFYVEANIDLQNRSSYQQRALGFLAERLMNVWVEVNTDKISRLPIYYYEKNKFVSAIKSFKRRFPKSYDPKSERG